MFDDACDPAPEAGSYLARYRAAAGGKPEAAPETPEPADRANWRRLSMMRRGFRDRGPTPQVVRAIAAAADKGDNVPLLAYLESCAPITPELRAIIARQLRNGASDAPARRATE